MPFFIKSFSKAYKEYAASKSFSSTSPLEYVCRELHYDCMVVSVVMSNKKIEASRHRDDQDLVMSWTRINTFEKGNSLWFKFMIVVVVIQSSSKAQVLMQVCSHIIGALLIYFLLVNIIPPFDHIIGALWMQGSLFSSSM